MKRNAGPNKRARRVQQPLWAGLLLGALACGCTGHHATGPVDADDDDPTEERSGGDLTVRDDSRDAYTRMAPNVRDDFDFRNRFFVGNSFFNQNWVRAPSSTEARDGLGPTFNATSCSACHFKDGRGAPPASSTEPFLGLLVRLSVPGVDEHGGPRPVPGYGDQFNHRALEDVPSEGHSSVTFTEQPGTYPDGTPYTLLRPSYALTDLALGPLPLDVMLSPRVAPAVFGLGLLEAIAEADLVAREDPEDANGDGVSGRANRVWDPLSGQTVLGRLGWKANQPGLQQQNAGAFVGDMGITSPLHPLDNCPPEQTACAQSISGGDPELSQAKLDDVTLYTRLLAVPARRNLQDQAVKRGKALFAQVGCTACHVQTWTTPLDASVLEELRGQTLHPYTDLLLHDLGEGLADGRPDFLATGTEWRTPPLWGLGLIHTVNGHSRLLHDGRARNAEEAILWHGGEAAGSRDAFAALPSTDRAALLGFLQSL